MSDETDIQPPALNPRAAKHHAARLEDLGAMASGYIDKSKADTRMAPSRR